MGSLDVAQRANHFALRLVLAMTAVLAGCSDDDGVDASPDTGSDARDTDVPRDSEIDSALPPALAVTLTVEITEEVAFLEDDACLVASLENAREDTRVTFFFGYDGEREVSAPRDGVARVCHRFPYPGLFVVSALAENRTERAEDAVALSVVAAPLDPRPARSSSIAAAADGGVWVVEEDADLLTGFTVGGDITARVEICDRPRTVALLGEVAAVACQGDAVAIVQRRTGAVNTIAMPGEPFGVIADPRGERFIVTLQTRGEIVVLDPDGVELARLDVGRDPRALAMQPNGQLLVTRWRGGPEGAEVIGVDLSDPLAPSLLPPTPLRPQTGLDSDTDNSGVPNYLDAIAFAPAGDRAFVPALKANNVTGRFRTSQPLTGQTTARAIVSELIVNLDGTAEEARRVPFDDLDFASAITLSRYGDRAYLAMMGSQRVIAMETFAFAVAGSIADVGIAPRGLLLVNDDETLLVHATLSREVRAYDVRDLSREPPLLFTVATVEEEPLPSHVLRGKQVFATSRDPRMSRTSYLSCASCHLDGSSDGLVWDFAQRGEGLRNTIALQGRGGLADGPLHWTANFDEIQDFEIDIRMHQEGSGFMRDDDYRLRTFPLSGTRSAGLSVELDALAAYLTTLNDVGVSPFREDSDAFRARRENGRAHFVTSGCATCHSAPRYTDSGTAVHDVGTLTENSGRRLGNTLNGIDTPSLRGVFRTAPYFHDGSAATLSDVLDRSVGVHGDVRGLDASERADLLLFLQTIDDLD